jgi:hypothetical protein
VRRAFVTVLVAASLLGCASQSTPPAEAPLRPVTQMQTPRQKERPRPRLIAPPPAYGNKVVMARAETRASFD